MWKEVTWRRRQQRRWLGPGQKWADLQEQATILRRAHQVSDKVIKYLDDDDHEFKRNLWASVDLKVKHVTSTIFNWNLTKFKVQRLDLNWSGRVFSNRDINGLFQVGRVQLDRPNLKNVFTAIKFCVKIIRFGNIFSEIRYDILGMDFQKKIKFFECI